MALDQSNNTHALLVRAAKTLYAHAQTLPISEARDQALIDSTALETLASKRAPRQQCTKDRQCAKRDGHDGECMFLGSA